MISLCVSAWNENGESWESKIAFLHMGCFIYAEEIAHNNITKLVLLWQLVSSTQIYIT